jgi:hypothetical protein
MKRKLLLWAAIVGSPLCVLVVYLWVFGRAAGPWSTTRFSILVGLAALPGLYGIALSVRAHLPRVAAMTAYLVAITVVFIFAGLIYSCDVLQDCL